MNADMEKNDTRLIVFVQIPKSAGSAMVAVMRQRWPISLGMICSRGHRMYKATCPLDWFDSEESHMEQFIEAVNVRINDLVWIAGHFHYGIHTYLKRPCRYITIIRDPVDRVISLEAHIRRTPGDVIHELWKKKYHLGLFKALAAGEFRVCNDATRMLDEGEYDYISRAGLPRGLDPGNGNENPPGSERTLSAEDRDMIASFNEEDMKLFHATRGKEVSAWDI